MEDKRIRLVFKDDDILSQTQKLDGLNRSWLLLKPDQHDTVSDVASHLLRAFQLHQSCPHGLLLSISGFVLPPFESTCILKDNEIIRVRKRRDILSITRNNAANAVEKLNAVEKQPENNGVLLLANEEFVKEKGGYESDDPDEESEEDDEGLLKDVENPSGGNADPKSRKRKAAEKLQGCNKKKKLRSGAAENVADGVPTEKKNIPSEEKKDGSNAEANAENNEGTAKLSDTNHVPVSDIKQNTEVQGNAKETEDGKSAPKETMRKRPSRSARRKTIKRRWLKEMAKIQKQNATCESEGLRNWKEDHAKAERKKGNDQWKGLKKWKKNQADGEKNEDDQPKGLLHWKQSPQTDWGVKGKKRKQQNHNGYFHKQPKGNGYLHEHENKNGDGLEQPTQNGDRHEQPNQKQSDVHEKSGAVQELPNPKSDASKEINEDSDEENEVVPIVIRPGHIRFEPLGKEQAVQQNHVPSDTFQWNGITSKKKGQQWGKENRSFTPRNDYKSLTEESSENKESSKISVEQEKQPDKKEKQPDEVVDFDKLPPLTTMPKEEDLIAYRILELSSTWTPELSSFRVGKVSWYNTESNQTMLLPVPEYPIVSQTAEEGEVELPDNALYKEDGSLEIDFSTLIDVRIFKNGCSAPLNEALSQLSEGSSGNENTAKTLLSGSNDKQTLEPNPENDAVNVWDQLGEALNAKKEQLSKENGWGKTPPKKVQPSPTNNWGKNAHKVQPSQGNNSGKQQGSGGKPWSYKALRSNGLGQTMAILRSKNDA